MRRSLGLLLALGVAGAPACSLFVTTDGLSGGSDAAVAGEAFDSGSDVIISSSDAGDAAANPDVDAGRFCDRNPGHTLCSDFDVGDLETGWTTSDLMLGTLSLSPDASVSAPLSMASVLPDLVGKDGDARLEYDIPLATKPHVHIELDIDICALATSGDLLEILKIGAGTGGYTSGIEVQLSFTGGQLLDEGATATLALARDIPRQTWAHLSLDVVRAASGSIRLELDGDTANPLINATGLDTTLANAENMAAILVGTYGNGTPACVTYYDNVLVDTE